MAKELSPEKIAFYSKYASLAMEQQQRYGIPASITLAQMYIESNGGTSRLAVSGNNFFGIKCSREWLAAGKPYSLHSDDRPNEKFCNYASVEESINHHSVFLMGKRYANCRRCESNDYQGWAVGLKAAGYATAPNYATSLIREIEDYNLSQYDQMAIQDAKRRGITIGHAAGILAPLPPSSPTIHQDFKPAYCFPIAGINLLMGDGFGKKPTEYRPWVHNGIDIAAKRGDAIMSTERGVVVAIKNDMTEHDSQARRRAIGNKGGNYVIVEYQRANGESYRVSYCHLTENGIAVKKGQTVEAGTVLGYAGSTGNCTGPHLHVTVKKGKNGVYGDAIDPLTYFAEIAVRGNLQGTVLKKGTNNDLLASLKGSVDTTPTPNDILLAERQNTNLTDEQLHNAEGGALLADATGSNDPKNMLAYLLGMNGDQVSQGGDLFSNLISGLFMAALGMAMQLDKGVNNNSPTVDDARRVVPSETEDPTVVKRHREGIDPVRSHELATINYDAEFPEEHQGTGQRLT